MEKGQARSGTEMKRDTGEQGADVDALPGPQDAEALPRVVGPQGARRVERPPLGMIARFRGASVCIPTISSRSRSMYPGACEVIVEGVAVSTSRIPLRRSSGKRALTVPHTVRVRSVRPTRKDASPSYGV